MWFQFAILHHEPDSAAHRNIVQPVTFVDWVAVRFVKLSVSLEFTFEKLSFISPAVSPCKYAVTLFIAFMKISLISSFWLHQNPIPFEFLILKRACIDILIVVPGIGACCFLAVCKIALIIGLFIFVASLAVGNSRQHFSLVLSLFVLTLPVALYNTVFDDSFVN